MKFLSGLLLLKDKCSRAPQGARGLKFVALGVYKFVKESRPARGAWVEIMVKCYHNMKEMSSRPARGAWVEMKGKSPS